MPLSDERLDACLDAALALAAWASDRIAEGPSGVRAKDGAADLVTDVDLRIEREVRDRLAERFPDHRVCGEEYGGEPGPGAVGAGPIWFVDPIDGTTNFANRLPWASFSLAVADELGAAVGVVADPYRREVFSAVRGRGASPSACSTATTVQGGVVLTELSGTAVQDGLPAMMATLSARGCVTRIMGSSALSLASVAAGRCVATVLDSYQPWDVLAGALIAAESGAVLLARDGRPHSGLYPGGLVAAVPGVADTVWKSWTRGKDIA
jgi:myo-inositol-1(or 4)-monophosphatase